MVSKFPAETAGLLGIRLSSGAGPMRRRRKERFFFCLHSVFLWVFKRVARPKNWPHQIWCHLFTFSVPPCRLQKNPFKRSPLSLSPPQGTRHPSSAPPSPRRPVANPAHAQLRPSQASGLREARYLKRRSPTPSDPPPSYNVESVTRFVVHYS